MSEIDNTVIERRVKTGQRRVAARSSHAGYIDSFETVVIFFPVAPWIETVGNVQVSELRIKPARFESATGSDVWGWIDTLVARGWLQFADASYAANAFVPGPACDFKSIDAFFGMFSGPLQHEGGVA